MPVDVVKPHAGVAERNRRRVLINLHGGGFIVGAGLGGQADSIPMAGLAAIKVITVDYREGPDHQFPAASEDVAAVYRELLKDYPAENKRAVTLFQGGGTQYEGPVGVACPSPSVLAGFPPTLLIAGTRDVGLPAAAYTQSQLVKAGIDTDLHEALSPIDNRVDVW